ncbi:MAG TPA: hypothetical protein VMP01_05645 [Pirellulaceae bacterium]|nr:hypothetical protein [Pirellulaceae bacterium]
MTIAELEQRVHQLEREMDELRRIVKPADSKCAMLSGFGMFANDPDFDEVVRLGREYRQQENDRDRL